MDSEKTRQSESIIKDFVGLYSDVEPCDIPRGGFAEQINVFSKQLGSIETRGGLVEVSLTIIDE